MSERLQYRLQILKSQTGTAVPTGRQLLMFVKATGDAMLVEMRRGNVVRYRELKDFYIQLLEIAQNDAYCAPILINSVQSVLDEEAEIYRSGQRRLDKSTGR